MNVVDFVKDEGLNERATAFAKACGFMDDIHGDAFVSRVWDNQEDPFERRGFAKDEVDTNVPWVLKAAAEQQAALEKLRNMDPEECKNM